MSLIHRLDARSPEFDAALTRLLAYDASQDEAIETAVRDILHDVRTRGDAAILDYTARFDHVRADRLEALEIPRADYHRILAAALSRHGTFPTEPVPWEEAVSGG